jgi:hypothetical protein
MKTDEELMNTPGALLTKAELEQRRAYIAREMEAQRNYVPKPEDDIDLDNLLEEAEDPPSALELARKPLSELVTAEYERIANSVRWNMRRLDRQGPEDLSLRNLWHEYAYQVQHEESFFYEFYVDQCREFALYEIEKRTHPLLCLLWLASDGFHKGDVEDPENTYSIEDIVEEVMQYVHRLADGEPVPEPKYEYDHGGVID